MKMYESFSKDVETQSFLSTNLPSLFCREKKSGKLKIFSQILYRHSAHVNWIVLVILMFKDNLGIIFQEKLTLHKNVYKLFIYKYFCLLYSVYQSSE